MWQHMYMQWMSMFMPGMPGMWPGGGPSARGTQVTPGLAMLPVNEIEFHADGRTTSVSFASSRPTFGGGKAQLRHHKTNDTLSVEVSGQGKIKIQLSAKQPTGHYVGDLKDEYGSPCGLVRAVVSE
jgi:hypothetical protein